MCFVHRKQEQMLLLTYRIRLYHLHASGHDLVLVNSEVRQRELVQQNTTCMALLETLYKRYTTPPYITSLTGNVWQRITVFPWLILELVSCVDCFCMVSYDLISMGPILSTDPDSVCTVKRHVVTETTVCGNHELDDDRACAWKAVKRCRRFVCTFGSRPWGLLQRLDDTMFYFICRW